VYNIAYAPLLIYRSESKEWLVKVCIIALSQASIHLSELILISQNQINKPYYAKYREIMTPKFLKPLEIKVLEKVGPQFTYFKRENGGLRE
jgi:hypothetical protein